MTVRQVTTLTVEEIASLRALMTSAFGDRFDEHDWAHALGGYHLLGYDGEELIAHAAVVERILHIGQTAMRTGYVEAVAVQPSHQRRGYGHTVMAAAGEVIAAHFELGALSARQEVQPLYRKLGWRVWEGLTYVDSPAGLERTEDDDGGVMVLAPQDFDLTQPITCDWREGDVW